MRFQSSDFVDFSIFASKDFNIVLLVLLLIATIGVFISLVIITRQVMKSRWIDSRSVKVLFFVITLSVVLLALLWWVYLLYSEIL